MLTALVYCSGELQKWRGGGCFVRGRGFCETEDSC
jgi:hypothetical protein